MNKIMETRKKAIENNNDFSSFDDDCEIVRGKPEESSSEMTTIQHLCTVR